MLHGLLLLACTLAPADRTFLERSLRSWNEVRARALQLPAAPLPHIVVFDPQCQWRGDDLAQPGVEHGGKVQLPTGETMPPSIVAFSATFGKAAQPFLVMSLPAVWKTEARHRDNPRLDLLLRAVFAHEMTHTRQGRAYGARIGELAAANHLGDDFDDDLVQDRFGDNAEFRAAYERERDLFFAAAAESDPAKRRALAKQAIAAMRDRHARWMTGANAYLAECEDVFLMMEGAANWAGMQVAIADGLTRSEAVEFMRGGRKHWVQDEGLALFLLLDSLRPTWKREAFGPKAVSLLQLLEGATTLAQP